MGQAHPQPKAPKALLLVLRFGLIVDVSKPTAGTPNDGNEFPTQNFVLKEFDWLRGRFVVQASANLADQLDGRDNL